MFNEIKIAQAEFQIRNAKLNTAHEVEGVTVAVPNVFDRALQALRAALSAHTLMVKPTHRSRVSGGAAAK